MDLADSSVDFRTRLAKILEASDTTEVRIQASMGGTFTVYSPVILGTDFIQFARGLDAEQGHMVIRFDHIVALTTSSSLSR